MLRKMGVNVVFLCCVVSLPVFNAVNYPPLAGAEGVDSYTKLMLHADGSDQGTSFTDSETTPKTVTNTESYDGYTKLMLHMEGSGNSFTDSATSKAVTANGDVTQTTAQFKLGSTSAVFDGNGDYLTLADSDDWDILGGDFTVDFWYKQSATVQSGCLANQFVDINNYWAIKIYDDGVGGTHVLELICISGGVKKAQYDAQLGGSLGTDWHHLAVVRSGSDCFVFKDGTSLSMNVYTAWAATMPTFAVSLQIGQFNPGSSPYYSINGWLDEYRISKGIARWTSDFTPPSSPYGKVATVTSQKKFGTASGEFKGSGEYLSLADSADWYFGTGDFTIDFWVRLNSFPASEDYDAIIGQHHSADNSSWRIAYNNTGGVCGWRLTEYDITLGWLIDNTWVSTISTGTWYHIALVRTGNTFKLFQNGTQVGSDLTNTSSLLDFADNLVIGAGWNGTLTFVDGNIDELRVSKGIARWTSNFTSPTAPYDEDTTAPTVSSTSPASSATGVGVSSAISATFSEDMDSSTITTSTFTLSSSSGSSVSGAVSYSNKVCRLGEAERTQQNRG